MVGLVSGSGDGDGDGDGGWEVGVAVAGAQQHCGMCCLIKTSCVVTFLGADHGNWTIANLEISGVVVVVAQQYCGMCCLIKTSCVVTFLGGDHGNWTIANLEINRSLSRRRVGGWLGVGEWGWGWGWGWGMGGGSGSGRCPAALWQVLSYQNQLCGHILGDRSW